MKSTVCILIIVVIVPQLYGQDLDLNMLTDAYFREKVNPLATLLPFAIGGSFTGDVGFLQPGEIRISVNEGTNFVSSELSVGPMNGVDRFSLPMFNIALGVDPSVELSGKFSSINIGNRAVVITGFGLRYKTYSNEMGDKGISFGVMVNALRGPEDFRIWDMTLHLDFLKVGESTSFKASIGADFSEMRISVKEEGNLLNEKNEIIERTQSWVAVGISQNIGDILFSFLQFQQGKSRRLNIGLGVRL
ncbi:MAG: hypothetical protein IIC40_02535 [Candidatus Marinimicrobia bacterium]|nr:hypothetical protein [Candidatus Neomarinimicrobiota bacterium]